MKIIATGWNTFHETGKYTCATVEYAGLFSYSIAKRGVLFVTGGVRTATRPVAKAVVWPWGVVRNKANSIFSGRKQEEKIKGLESRLLELESRLINIEKHGAAPIAEPRAAKKAKDLEEDKRFVLKSILEDTKSLQAPE